MVCIKLGMKVPRISGGLRRHLVGIVVVPNSDNSISFCLKLKTKTAAGSKKRTL